MNNEKYCDTASESSLKGEGSVQLTSLYKLVQIWSYVFLIYKTTYLNKEVTVLSHPLQEGIPTIKGDDIAEWLAYLRGDQVSIL